MYSYFIFRGENIIADSSRTKLFIGLSGAGLLGVFTLLFLRRKRPSDSSESIGSLNARCVLCWYFHFVVVDWCGRTCHGRPLMVHQIIILVFDVNEWILTQGSQLDWWSIIGDAFVAGSTVEPTPVSPWLLADPGQFLMCWKIYNVRPSVWLCEQL